MEANLMRSVIMNCVRDDNDLPAAYRWLFKYHVNESISQFAPYVNKYATYRALPLPPNGEEVGTYNWIMTEHYWLINPFDRDMKNHYGLAFNEYWGKDFHAMTNQAPSKLGRNPDWQGTKDGYHPIVFCFVPIFWEEDYRKTLRNHEDGPNYRWMIVHKYPEGVSQEEGDDWFLNSFMPEICDNPEVNIFLTSKVLDVPRTGPFQRVTEVWFDDSRAWHKVVVEKADKYTKPAWATHGVFPYLAPYEDLCSIFLMDRPESDHLRQFHGYITCR